MAVFLLNVCKFNGCGITFPSLSDLITHIEDTHIDYDPKVVEQKEQSQPACLPLSYVLRFISDDARKDGPFLNANATGVELKRKLAIKHHSYSMSSSNRSNTPTGSEMDDDEMVVSESEDSNESWTTEEFSSEFIMRYGSRHSGSGSNGAPGNEKPFACPVPGCKKRYKNVNGIKYHSKNGHKKDGKVRKGYKCHCGKSYKTAQGLKNHALLTHNSTSEGVVNGSTTGNGNNGSVLIQRSSSPSQSLGSLSPSSISNMSSSASSCHGSNITHNGASAVLQQLTNTNLSGSNNLQQQLINVTAISNNKNNSNSQNSQQLNNHSSNQHYQQANSLTAHSIVTTATATAQTTESPCLSVFDSASASVSASASFIYTTTLSTTASTTLTTTTTKIAAATTSTPTTALIAPANSTIATSAVPNGYISHLPAATTITTNTKKIAMHLHQLPLLGTTLRTPMQPTTKGYPSMTTAQIATPAPAPTISPTFIEHKYSANIYKEKFMSHLRNTNQIATNSSPNKLFTTNTPNTFCNPNNAANNANTGLQENIVDANNTNIGELCSSLQQLNESFKNNLFQKTIN